MMCHRFFVALLAAVLAIGSFAAPPALAVESFHFGYSESFPAMTNAIRLSGQIGYAWWSANKKRYNVEPPQAGIPYSYHDGYPNLIGTTFTPQYAAARWKQILDGNGDPYTQQTGAQIGKPTIILVDEVASIHQDTAQGPALRQALQIFTTTPPYNRNHIVLLCSPGISQGSGVIKSNYDDVIFCANNYCRYFVLEVYVTQTGFNTGHEPGGTGNIYGKGDAYLANRLTFGIRNWTTTMGVNSSRVMPMILINNNADVGYTNFYKFMNRCFWFMANGWYNAAHSGVDANIKAALRNGVGSYSWDPDQLNTGTTTRDTYFERYLKYYSVDGFLTAHPDGLSPPPP